MTLSFEQPKKEAERSPEQMETIRNFETQENTLIESSLNRAKESGRKKTGFKAMAASLALLTASTISERAFAESAPTEKLTPKTGATEVYTPAKTTEQSSWDKLIDRVNLTVSTKQEVVKTPVLGAENFYRQLSREDRTETVMQMDKIIRQSTNAKDFFQKLSSTKDLSDTQKILAIQNMGGLLAATYNFDMLNRNEHVAISDDKMFENMKLYYETGKVAPTGICGNIHTFMAKAAGEMGVDAWLQSGVVGKDKAAAHVWVGALASDASGSKQIVFLDYNNLIPTGTRNYGDALGIAERAHSRIGTFNSFVSIPEKTLFPVESRAEKTVKEAAGFKGSEPELSERLATGKITRPEELNLEISDETKKIELNKDWLALAYIDYKDMGNPYQSLDSMQALRGSLRLGDEHLGLNWDATLLNLNVKDLGSGTMAQQEIINRLSANFVNSYEISKAAYGKLLLNYGLTLESGMRLLTGKTIMAALQETSRGEGSAGIRLMYVNPAETGKFYIETTASGRLQGSDPQEQKLVLKEIGNKLKLGGSLEVQPGTAVNLETAVHRLEYGIKDEIELGIETNRLKFQIGSESVSSEFKKFIPSSEKVSAEFGYRLGSESQPKGEIVIFGSQLKEHYEGRDEPDKYEMGVKMVIFLW